jgi:hypothetical protein
MTNGIFTLPGEALEAPRTDRLKKIGLDTRALQSGRFAENRAIPGRASA